MRGLLSRITWDGWPKCVNELSICPGIENASKEFEAAITGVFVLVDSAKWPFSLLTTGCDFGVDRYGGGVRVTSLQKEQKF